MVIGENCDYIHAKSDIYKPNEIFNEKL